MLRLLLALGFFAALWRGSSSARSGEFVAGSMILTQKALDEAPERYSHVLREALDAAEKTPIPSESSNRCSKGYEIHGAGNVIHTIRVLRTIQKLS